MQSITSSSSTFWEANLPDERIPVARPRLPSVDDLAPYIRRIDANRWYSNYGPLVRELEGRLAAATGQAEARAVTVSNATIGLTLALQAQGAARGTLCMMPAWTFAATAHAAMLAGLVPWIVDVSADTWALDPRSARDLLRHAPGVVSAVVAVAPFGHPIDPSPWEAFRDQTGLAVVLDAAASFDTVRASTVPAVVSLHATKVLGIGEGGYIVSTDPALIESVQQRAQFGFCRTRESLVPAVNGKISEYAAAVGLAALDAWPARRSDYLRVARVYRAHLADTDAVALQEGQGERWVTSTVVAHAPTIGAAELARALATHHIGSRRWWGGGLHRHAAFQACPRLATPHTDALADSVIGLPCWPDLTDAEIATICGVVARAGR